MLGAALGAGGVGGGVTATAGACVIGLEVGEGLVVVGGKTGAPVASGAAGATDLKKVVEGQSQLSRTNGRTIAAIAKAATTKIPMTIHLCLPCETLGSSTGPSSTSSTSSSLIILIDVSGCCVFFERSNIVARCVCEVCLVTCEKDYPILIQSPNCGQISRFGDFSSNKSRLFVSEVLRKRKVIHNRVCILGSRKYIKF